LIEDGQHRARFDIGLITPGGRSLKKCPTSKWTLTRSGNPHGERARAPWRDRSVGIYGIRLAKFHSFTDLGAHMRGSSLRTKNRVIYLLIQRVALGQ